MSVDAAARSASTGRAAPAAGTAARLRGALASPAALAGLALVWLVTAAILWLDLHAHRRAVTERAELLSRVVADQADRQLRTAEDVAHRAVGRVAALPRGTPRAATERLLEDLQAGHRQLHTLSLVAADGRVVAHSRALPGDRPLDAAVVDRLRRDPGARRWVALAGHELEGASTPDSAGPAAPVLLVHARPVPGPEARTPAPLLVATVRLEDLSPSPLQLPDGDAWRSGLLTPDGRGGTGATPYPGADRSQVTARHRLADVPLSAWAATPRTGLLSDWWPSARPLAAAAALASASLLLFAVLLARRQQERDAAQAESRRAIDHAARRDAELRTLVDSLPEWMFRTDAEGRVTFVNRRWRQLSGRDDAAAIGRHLGELLDPRDAQAVQALLADPAGGRPEDVSAAPRRIVRLVAADGSVRELELTLGPVGEDAVRGWAGYAVDVTEREAARRQASEQYRLTEQLIDAMPLPLFLTDLRGDLLLANRLWVDWLGVGALAGDPADGDDPDLSRVHDVIGRGTAEVIAHGPRTWPIDLPGPGGRLRETLLTKVPLLQDGHGQPLGVIGTLVDVTEFRQAERITERARRAAEAASQARAEFVANVSHELRTPLQSIIGFAELGRDRGDPGARVHGMFVRIHDSGRRMLRLVEDLLDVSRLGSPMGRIDVRSTPLVPVVEEVLDELRPLAASRGIALQLRHAPELVRREAPLDPARYAQVLRNVVANAIRFSPTGQPIEIGVVDADGIALAAVRDHGPGIPEDELDEIFEPFVQSSRTRDGSGGTGLGLAICRRIMQAHGGFVTADNSPRGGAVFRIGIRWADATPPAATADAPTIVSTEAAA